MNTAMTGPRALALVALMLGALVPIGVTTPSGAAGTCNHAIKPYHVPGQEPGNIKASTPLAEEFSVSQILVMVTEDDRQTPHENRVNGIDAYVHDIGCAADGLDFRLRAWTGQDLSGQHDDADMAVHFYDESFDFLGMVTEDGDDDEFLRGEVEDRTRYVVIVMEDGPLISGIDYTEFPPEPYSVKFRMKLG